MADPNQALASKYVARDFFVYNTVHAAVAPAGTNTQSVQINADADFQVEKLAFFADIAAAGQMASTLIIPLCTILITDTGSGRQLMDQALPIASMFGTGQLPFVLKQPKIFQARTNISVQVVNFDAANTYNVRLSFIGSKLFLRS
jgi:hypothetical protein